MPYFVQWMLRSVVTGSQMSPETIVFDGTFLYLSFFPFFPLCYSDWEPFKGMICLLISYVSSAQHNSSSPTGRLWSTGSIPNNNKHSNNNNNNTRLLFCSSSSFLLVFWTFYKDFFFSRNAVAYFAFSTLNWVMVLPQATLVKCCSYLPRAEAGGEPVVLPFLFLLHKL